MQQDLKFELDQDLQINQVKPYQFIEKAHSNSIQAMDSTPDGRFFASGSHDHTIKLWDLETTKQVVTLKEHTQGVWSLDYSSDGSQLLSSSPDKTIILWDNKSNKPINKFLGHKDKVYSAKFNESNKQLASIGQGGQLLIWDVGNFDKPVKSIQLDTVVGYDIQWSKNEEILLIPSLASKLFVLDAKNFDILCSDKISQGEDSKCQSVVANFNTFPGRIFTATDTGHISWHEYKNKSMEKQTQFLAHQDACRCVAMHKEKKILLSSGRDGSVRLWNCDRIGHPKIIGNLVYHKQNVTNVRFATQQVIITGSWDTSIGMWKLADLTA